MTAEHQRLAVNATKEIPLAQWGPYLSERQWGTVREDYGPWSMRGIIFLLIIHTAAATYGEKMD